MFHISFIMTSLCLLVHHLPWISYPDSLSFSDPAVFRALVCVEVPLFEPLLGPLRIIRLSFKCFNSYHTLGSMWGVVLMYVKLDIYIYIYHKATKKSLSFLGLMVFYRNHLHLCRRRGKHNPRNWSKERRGKA